MGGHIDEKLRSPPNCRPMRSSLLLVAICSVSVDAFVISQSGLKAPCTRVRHASPTLGLFDGLMKAIDPENAAARGVLADELSGGDGSSASLERTRKRQAEQKKQSAAASGGGGFNMAFEAPKLPNLPNPFGGKK